VILARFASLISLRTTVELLDLCQLRLWGHDLQSKLVLLGGDRVIIQGIQALRVLEDASRPRVIAAGINLRLKLTKSVYPGPLQSTLLTAFADLITMPAVKIRAIYNNYYPLVQLCLIMEKLLWQCILLRLSAPS
jgi:hypothetical protein